MPIAELGVSLLTSAVYDAVKFAAHSFFYTEDLPADLRKEIEQRLTQQVPEEIQPLFESSLFVSYFRSPQFMDMIGAYLEYKLLYDHVQTQPAIRKYILENTSVISQQTIAAYISDQIYSLYSNSNVYRIPSKTSIFHAAGYILDTALEVMASSLSQENSRVVFLLSTRMDQQYGKVTAMLSSLEGLLSHLIQLQVEPPREDFQQTREQYHSILLARNYYAHIYLLDKFPFDEFYVPPVLVPMTRRHDDFSFLVFEKSVCWQDIFSQRNIVYITGGAGYGKTLFTKNLINHYPDLHILGSEDYLVISGEWKSFCGGSQGSCRSVMDFLKESIKRSSMMEVSDAFIQYFLSTGRCLILLDALDEVDKACREDLHDTVVAFFQNQNPNNKIVITSRDKSFIPNQQVQILQICQLNEEDIGAYVNKIIALGKFEEADKDAFLRQTHILVERDFLRSFLILSLLINIYKAERALPENKLELYQKCFEYIANRREKDKNQREFDWRSITPIMKDSTFIELARLGLPNNANIERQRIKTLLLRVYKAKYASEAETENAIDEFLKFCTERTELFVLTQEDQFRFFHRSFFEYFYSQNIFLRCRSPQAILAQFKKFDIDSEVFELTTAMLKQQSEDRYQALIRLMLDQAAEEIECGGYQFSALNSLIPAMQVVDDVLYRRRFLDLICQRDKIIHRIDNIHNLSLLTATFSDDPQASAQISEAYQQDCLEYLYSCCASLRLPDASELPMDQIASAVRRRSYFRYLDKDHFFYQHYFALTRDISQILLEADYDSVLSVFRSSGTKDPEDLAQKCMSTLAVYRQLPADQQAHYRQLLQFRGRPIA